MHAIVRQGDGKYYISAVFGHYCDVTAEDEYERYLESIHNAFWVVWDPEKKRLIRWLDKAPGTVEIIQQIIIIDSDYGDWIMDDNGYGSVDFLDRSLLDSILDEEVQPEYILEKCRLMDAGYVYEEITEIKTEKDIDDLMTASHGFHDAYIYDKNQCEDGTLFVRFKGIWGCEINML